MNSTKARVLLAALATGGALMTATHAGAQPIEEDDPGWSCVDDGNRVCGPGNSNGVPAGCYDDGGVLFAPWPCTPWRPIYGWRHGDGTTTFPNGDVMNDEGIVLIDGATGDCYDTDGQLQAHAPCHLDVHSDGSADVVDGPPPSWERPPLPTDVLIGGKRPQTSNAHSWQEMMLPI